MHSTKDLQYLASQEQWSNITGQFYWCWDNIDCVNNLHVISSCSQHAEYNLHVILTYMCPVVSNTWNAICMRYTSAGNAVNLAVNSHCICTTNLAWIPKTIRELYWLFKIIFTCNWLLSRYYWVAGCSKFTDCRNCQGPYFNYLLLTREGANDLKSCDACEIIVK